MSGPHKKSTDQTTVKANFILGIDIGTTSVKVCLIDILTKEIVLKNVKDTLAGVPSVQGSQEDVQDVTKIYSALHMCIARIPKDRLRSVVHIAVCGQMHGVIYWRHGEAWRINAKNQLEIANQVSPLYTWQDQRCSPSFLSSLPAPHSHLSINTGYGCATTFWLSRNNPQFLEEYDRCGTVMDFVVAMILELDSPIMSDQNAASFGYFDPITQSWNENILEEAGFPTHLLPKVIKSGLTAGKLSKEWFDIPVGTPVSAAMGDLQCSVKATLHNPTKDVKATLHNPTKDVKATLHNPAKDDKATLHNPTKDDKDAKGSRDAKDAEGSRDAVLNVSTSAQLAFVLREDFQQNSPSTQNGNTVQYWPYFQDEYIGVAASLTGGNSLAAFVKMIQQWVIELGLSSPQSKIWEKIIMAGMAESEDSSIEIVPTLYGERHDPHRTGRVSNVQATNLGLGQVTRSLCKGIIQNLADMMTPELLKEKGVERILGSGACLLRNPVLKRELQNLYQIPVEFVEEGNACAGAAMAVAQLFY